MNCVSTDITILFDILSVGLPGSMGGPGDRVSLTAVTIDLSDIWIVLMFRACLVALVNQVFQVLKDKWVNQVVMDEQQKWVNIH